ncbi:TPA: hypothetical protein VM666_000224 [Streptococcus pyogenes]|nr:hypothetical protein [Streptococcus pyogenes]
MQIKELTDINENTNLIKPTDEELQREYNYLLAEELSKKLLANMLITPSEFEKIMIKNRSKFQPFLSKIVPKLLDIYSV